MSFPRMTLIFRAAAQKLILNRKMKNTTPNITNNYINNIYQCMNTISIVISMIMIIPVTPIHDSEQTFM